MQSLKKRLIPLVVVFFLSMVWPAGLAGAQSDGLAISAEAGLDGYCKQGAWLPVQVTVENNGEDVDGQLYARTENAGEAWDFIVELSLPTVSRKQVLIYLFPLDNENRVIVGLRERGRTLAEIEVPVNCVPESDLLFGVWAENASIFNTQTAIGTGAGRASLVQVDAEHIPDRPIGLSMLDSLTISGEDTGALTEDQRAAIAGWVANGGRLVIAGGTDWQQTASGLAALLPLAPQGTSSLDDLSAIQSYTRSTEPLEGGAVAAVGALHPESTVLIQQGDVPLVIRRPTGLGEVLYFAVDPALEPLRTWIDMQDLYQLLLGKPADAPAWRNGFTEWANASEGLNAIPGLGIPSPWLVCGFLLLYVLAVGPINFVFLRTTRRREMAWITIPILVIVFTGCMFTVGTTSIGSRPVINRLTLVEVWPEASEADVHGLIGIFSPGRDTFDLEVEDGFIAHPVPRLNFPADLKTTEIIQTDAGFKAADIQVDIGGLENYAAAGRIPAPSFSQALSLTSSIAGGLTLTGEITNLSSIRLQDALILTSGPAIPIGDFGPGDTFHVSNSLAGSSSLGSNPGIAGTSDDTLYAIFGTNYMYSASGANIEEFRRFKLLSSALNWPTGTRGTGFYLIGWTEESPFETRLSGAAERNADTTLYVIQLTPDYETPADGAGGLVLTPDRFTWSEFETPTGANKPSPYETSIRTGSFALQFVPVNYPSGAEVNSLTFHLEGYGQTGPVDLLVQVWNFEEGGWVQLPEVRWGDTELGSPDQLVGPGGQIRVRFTGTGTQIDIERADFTLVIQP